MGNEPGMESNPSGVWVPITERLPEVNQPVWIRLKDSPGLVTGLVHAATYMEIRFAESKRIVLAFTDDRSSYWAVEVVSDWMPRQGSLLGDSLWYSPNQTELFVQQGIEKVLKVTGPYDSSGNDGLIATLRALADYLEQHKSVEYEGFVGQKQEPGDWEITLRERFEKYPV